MCNIAKHKWSESHDPASLRLVLALQRAHEVSFTHAKQIWARYALTPAEFDVLATLRNAPPPHRLTPSQLQSAVLITSGGLTKVMNHLAASKHVRRFQIQGDLRIKPIALTPRGKRLVEQVMAELAATTGSWLRNTFPDNEIANLTLLLERLACAP